MTSDPSEHVPAAELAVGGDIPPVRHNEASRSLSRLDPGRTRFAAVVRQRMWVSAIRYSGVLGIAVLVVGFSLYLPGLFFSQVTFRTIISAQAITGILALGALIPLAAGLIDLSFGSVGGLAIVLSVWMTVHTSFPYPLIMLIAIGSAAACGLVSGLLVALIKLDSFIVTLGMSSLVLGIGELITSGNTIFGTFSPGVVSFSQGSLGPVPYLTLVLAALAAVVWVWLEHTPSGRYTLAVGSNPLAARLAGIAVARTQIAALVASAAVAGLGGTLLAAQVGSGSTTTGPGYLLPVIAALFLGETQVRERPNVVGTLIAIFLLGTGIKGLQLAGASTWTTDAFNGAVLLLAVGMAAVRRRQVAAGS